MAKVDVPVLVRHCALAIYKSGDVHGNVFERVTSAFNIARHRLVAYGFLMNGSQLGGPENVKLTGKGHMAEARHRRKSDGHLKTKEWDQLYALISEAAEEEPGEGGTVSSPEPQGSDRDTRKAQQRVRAARSAEAGRRTRVRRPKRARRVKRR